MCGATCLTIKNGPRRLTAITLSHSSPSISVHFVSCSGANSAALFTSTSILPKRSMVAATSALTAVSSLTSAMALATELAPCSAAISCASSLPSAMSAIAARPDSLAMALLLRAHAADEFFEFRELLLDHANGRLILELERLLVEFLRGEGDDDLGPAEQDDVDGSQRLPQMILHARAAEDAAGGRLQRHRLVLERLLLHARHPIDRILEAAGDRPIVLGRHDDQPIGAADGVRPDVHVGRKAG